MKSAILVQDLRKAFLERIFKHYPDHKKTWTASEIQNEFAFAMHDVAMEYFEEIDKA